MINANTKSIGSDGVVVSVVIPCLNEGKTLVDVVQCALSAFTIYGYDGEVIVADNGSSDDSRQIANSMPIRLIDVRQRGYGSALRSGMELARGRYIIIADADDTYDLNEMHPLVQALQAGSDLVIGTRLKGYIEKGAMPYLHRYLGTPVLTFLINLLFGLKISDCNSGMRGITNESFRRLGLKCPGMEFATEMIVRAAILKLKVSEVPVTLRVDRRLRPSHLRPWSDGLRQLRVIMRYWLDKLIKAAKTGA